MIRLTIRECKMSEKNSQSHLFSRERKAWSQFANSGENLADLLTDVIIKTKTFFHWDILLSEKSVNGEKLFFFVVFCHLCCLGASQSV